MSTDTYKFILSKLQMSVAEHEMIFDKKGRPIDYKFVYVNEFFCESLGLKEEDVIGKTVLDILPNTEPFWIDTFGEVVLKQQPKQLIDHTVEFDRYFDVYAFPTSEKTFVASFTDVTNYVKHESAINDPDLINTFTISSKSAFFDFDMINNKLTFSENLESLLGVSDITIDKYLREFFRYIHPDDVRRVVKLNRDIAMGRKEEITVEIRFKNESLDDYIWINYFAYVSEKKKYLPIRIQGIIKDITDEKRIQREHEEHEELFKKARKIANITTLLYLTDVETFEYSEELSNFLGIEGQVTLSNFRKIVHKDDVYEFDSSTDYILEKRSGGAKYRIHKNGEIRYIQSSLYAIRNEKGRAVKISGILRDVTEEELNRQKIEFLASRDLLTHIYNRNYFEQYTSKLTNETIGIIICDIDGLKLINDAFGHLEGDQLLVNFADHLSQTFQNGTIARIGGDEFALLFDNASFDQLEQYERQIKEYTKDLFIYGISIDASIGFSVKQSSDAFSEAFIKAENIMYRRKLTGRSSRKSNSLNTIMQTIHEKTHETEEHCKRVGVYAADLLIHTGHKRTYEVDEIKLVALVHDIGKIAIDERILSKPSRLTDAEFNTIKSHCESGYKIVTNILSNDDIAMAVLYHHERYDGTGYPHGLTGKEIPLYSRIISICDAYDAMVSGRVYRAAIDKEEALQELISNKSTQFDPELVDLFVELMNKGERNET